MLPSRSRVHGPRCGQARASSGRARRERPAVARPRPRAFRSGSWRFRRPASGTSRSKPAATGAARSTRCGPARASPLVPGRCRRSRARLERRPVSHPASPLPVTQLPDRTRCRLRPLGAHPNGSLDRSSPADSRLLAGDLHEARVAHAPGIRRQLFERHIQGSGIGSGIAKPGHAQPGACRTTCERSGSPTSTAASRAACARPSIAAGRPQPAVAAMMAPRAIHPPGPIEHRARMSGTVIGDAVPGDRTMDNDRGSGG